MRGCLLLLGEHSVCSGRGLGLGIWTQGPERTMCAVAGKPITSGLGAMTMAPAPTT